MSDVYTQAKSIDTFSVGGRTFGILYKFGEVLEVSTHVQSHVTGGGGGGSISTNSQGHVSGHISSVSISSYATTKTKIWVKTPEGAEEDWSINKDISVRAGHRLVKIVLGEVNPSDPTRFSGEVSLIALYNCSADYSFPITAPDAWMHANKLVRTSKIANAVMLLSVIGALVGFFTFINQYSFSSLMIFAASVVFFLYGWSNRAAAKKETSLRLATISNKLTESFEGFRKSVKQDLAGQVG